MKTLEIFIKLVFKESMCTLNQMKPTVFNTKLCQERNKHMGKETHTDTYMHACTYRPARNFIPLVCLEATWIQKIHKNEQPPDWPRHMKRIKCIIGNLVPKSIKINDS